MRAASAVHERRLERSCSAGHNRRLNGERRHRERMKLDDGITHSRRHLARLRRPGLLDWPLDSS